MNINKQRRGVIYARVSTDKQEDGTSLQHQIEDCQKYAIENGIVIVGIFQESYTGFLYRDRKELSKARKLIQEEKIDAFLVRTYDRLSRDQIQFSVLIEEMEYHHVEPISPREQLDNTAFGKFHRAAIAFVAELEREKLLDRTITGRRDIALVHNKPIPGSKPRYGYRWDDEKEKAKLIAVEPEAEVVRRIFHLYVVDRASQLKIAKTLDEEGIKSPSGGSKWSEATVRRILMNAAYIGQARTLCSTYAQEDLHNGKGRRELPLEEQFLLPEGTVEPIIDEETFRAAQALMGINGVNRQDAARNNGLAKEFLLRAGFVTCGVCGANLTTKQRRMKGTNGKEYSYWIYRCVKRLPNHSECNGPTANTKALDDQIWAKIEELAGETERISEAIEEVLKQDTIGYDINLHKRTRAKLQIEYDQYSKDLKSELLRGPARDRVLFAMSEVGEKLASLDDQIEKLRTQQIDQEAIKGQFRIIETWCKTIRTERKALTYEQRRAFLRLLGLQVTLYREDDKNHPKRWEINLDFPQLTPLMFLKGAEEDSALTFTLQEV